MTRRAVTVGLLLLPALAWCAVHVYVGAHVDEWAGRADLPYAIRLAIVADHSGNRFLPLIGLVAIVSSPLLALGIARGAGALSLPGEATAPVLLRWWGASVFLFLAFVGLMVAQRPRLSMGLAWGFPAVHATLAWSAFVCGAVSLGATYVLQRDRHARGASRLDPRWVFGIAAPLQCLGWPALFVPIGFWLRARRDGAPAAAGR